MRSWIIMLGAPGAESHDDLHEMAHELGGGAGDDGWSDFCSWLISRGQAVYLAALRDPSTLRPVAAVSEAVDFEEFQYVARRSLLHGGLEHHRGPHMLRQAYVAGLFLATLAACNPATATVDVSILPEHTAADLRPDSVGDRARPPDTAASAPQLTVLVDNYPFNPSLKTGWGYACAVTGLPKTVLLDTGMDSTTMLENRAWRSIPRRGS